MISEGIGATITPTNEYIEIKKDNNIIVLTTGTKIAIVNGNTVPLDVSIEHVNNRTMLPLRFVSEQLGLDVAWNGTEKIITLTSKPVSNNGQNGGENSGGSNPTTPTTDLPTVKPVKEVGVRGVWISTVFNID
ncbi:hypothetical protein D3C77_358620 [compost metagenome]